MAYTATNTLIFTSVFGNKRVSLLKVDITNYNATGIPLTARIVGMSVIEAALVFLTGVLNEAANPILGVFDAAGGVVHLYTAANTLCADAEDLNADVIMVYILAIGV